MLQEISKFCNAVVQLDSSYSCCRRNQCCLIGARDIFVSRSIVAESGLVQSSVSPVLELRSEQNCITILCILYYTFYFSMPGPGGIFVCPTFISLMTLGVICGRMCVSIAQAIQFSQFRAITITFPKFYTVIANRPISRAEKEGPMSITRCSVEVVIKFLSQQYSGYSETAYKYITTYELMLSTIETKFKKSNFDRGNFANFDCTKSQFLDCQ